MRKIYFIGTLHGFTKENELEEILVQLEPNQLIVEIEENDIQKNRMSGYPVEMIWATNWARKRRIKVFGMDCDINVLEENKTSEDEKKLLKRERKIINEYGWKNFNQESYLKLLNFPEDEGIVDKSKFGSRQEKMLENIKSNTIRNGNIVVLTGAGHLAFFEEKIPSAIFPLRN
jgi:hypothetical protein